LQGWFQLGVRLVTLPKSGHWPFRDQWKRTNQEISSFLAIAHNVEKDVL
jgi:pimeloyl-ACP methyl ester carboxylesterase